MEHRIVSRIDRPVVTVPTPFHHPLAPVATDPAPILLPIIGANEDFTPAVARLVDAVAVRAQTGDWTARDALYQALSVKLRRICHTIQVPPHDYERTGTWDHEDVWQEGWLVFAAILDRWSGGGSFAHYLLAQFPWRLRDAVRANLRRSAVPPRWSTFTGTLEDHIAICPVAQDRQDQVELDCCLAPLTVLDRDLIAARQWDRLSIAETATVLEIAERTVSRRMAHLRREIPRLLDAERA